MDNIDDGPIVLLAAFEVQIFRALARRSMNWRWVGYSEPGEFIRLIEDRRRNAQPVRTHT